MRNKGEMREGDRRADTRWNWIAPGVVLWQWFGCSPFVDGVVAQLVERLVRNEKVAGSNPVGSTISTAEGPRTHLINRGGSRCEGFGDAARREEGEY